MRILLVDDHAIVREGLRRILADSFPGAEFGEAATVPEALRLVRSSVWDVVLLDISMPGRGGMEALKEVHALFPRLPVLMMTMYAEDQYALRAFRAGASGYLNKGSDPEALPAAIRKVMAGGRYVSPALAEHFATMLPITSGRPPHELLSDRELQVVQLLAGGLTVKEIGARLFLSEKTVSTYRTRILEKMGMRTNAEVMRYAMDAKLVS